MTQYHCTTSAPESLVRVLIAQAIYPLICCAILVHLYHSYIRPRNITLYIPPFNAPTELRLERNITKTITSLLRPYSNVDIRFATANNWILYDLERKRIIHSEVAKVYLKGGGKYLVVSRRGGEGAALVEMVRTWVKGDAKDVEVVGGTRGVGGVGGGGGSGKPEVERWVQDSEDGTIGTGSITPTSSVGFMVLNGNGDRW
ncbi:hypothetical protein BDD12DRAFT_854047 [Trichophaea hybrida]|nr:hypothetical protein BDD12DRAFT_854047 [Trichophaea hybrida]